MEFLTYFWIAFVAYFGLVSGIILALMTKEELQPGRRYFVLMHNIILGFILFFVLEFLDANVYLALFLPLILIIILFRYPKIYKKSWAIYPLLGLAFYISSKNINHLLIASTLIFFYGCLITSMQTRFRKKDFVKIVLKNMLFFICLLLFFI